MKILRILIAIAPLVLAGQSDGATAATLTTLWEFSGSADGAKPYGALF